MRALLFTTTLLLGAGAADAQRLNVYDPIPGPGFIELTAPDVLLPLGTPPVAIYPLVPVLPPPPPFFVPPGDSSFSGTTGLNWYTNGLFVASSPTIMYPPLAPPTPPIAVPPAVLAAIGGPVTGLAYDAAGMLWLVSAPGIIVGVLPFPGMPIVVPPFPGPFFGLPIVGLEWDGITGTLLAVDVAGTVFQFFPGGFPFAPPIPPLFVFPAVPGDVAIDKTGYLNIDGLRPIYVLAGPIILDVTLLVALPLPSGATPLATGLAFHAYPAAVPPLGVCACPGLPLTQGTTGPMTSGNATFALTVGGLPPGTITLFAFDFLYDPAFPLVNGVGCGLGFFFGSPSLVSGIGFAGAGGTAAFPLPLFVPPGFGPLFNQNGTLCPADPAGFVLTPMHLIWVSGT